MEMEDLSCTSLKLKDIHVFHLLLSLMYWDKGVDFDKLHKMCIQTKIALELMHFNFQIFAKHLLRNYVMGLYLFRCMTKKKYNSTKQDDVEEF